MSYQPRVRSAIWTTLVLILVCVSSITGLAAAQESNVTGNAGVQNPSTTQTAKVATPSPTPPVGMSRANDKQSEQGKQYGQPGFVGEPINLNVVNADIRDILNYITEQYGVNFVIDSSVAAVPVTVNVQDVPWNIALDAVLKANRLGIESSGNILRVATTEVLAKEAETQKVINDSRLDASPLVTEFIRLNYARASGTLAQAAGSTGAFSGGATNLSFSGGAGGDSTGGSGDQGLLPIISRRLSRRGGIEVDGRSNTLIITDVKENIEAIRQLVAILDQPEPQVEIETRIVIAQRNFSRDLGAQLSAGVVNLTRGGLGNISTAAGTRSNRNWHVVAGLERIWYWFRLRFWKRNWQFEQCRSKSVWCVWWSGWNQSAYSIFGCRGRQHGHWFNHRIVWYCANQCFDHHGRVKRSGEDCRHSARYRFEQSSRTD